MEPKGALLEAKRNFGGVSKGRLYEVVDIDKYENYSLLWYRDDEGVLDYTVYPTLTIYGDLFNIYWQL